MFHAETYRQRRAQLRSDVKTGLILLPGNQEASYNYPSNVYRFRQDSNFLYFFGLNEPDYVGVIDIDSGEDHLFANDLEMEDIIWSGHLPTVSDLASRVGVALTSPLSSLKPFLDKAIREGRSIHFCNPYRSVTRYQLSCLLGHRYDAVKNFISTELIRAIVKQRSIKSEEEIVEIEKAVSIAYEIHTEAMRMATVSGTYEYQIAGKALGIAAQHNGYVSFPIICSIHGQTLHNHRHDNLLTPGRMLVLDCGAELDNGYCSDITRTTPVGGRFDERQKAFYNIVLEANLKSIAMAKPGIKYKDIHFLACLTIAEGLKKLGLMKGDMLKAVELGAHALFMPHGLGHMMGLDVHDMENLGENFVGYDDDTQRAKEFGTAYLRCGRMLQKGFVMTVEPGLYFIPALIDQWENEGRFAEYIQYSEVNKHRDFGGIRIEDDILITDKGCRVLGPAIPKTIEEIESLAPRD